MLHRTIHKLEVLDGCAFVVFENHDKNEDEKMEHILVWFLRYKEKFYGDFITLGDGTDIPELVEMQTKQAQQTIEQLKKEGV